MLHCFSILQNEPKWKMQGLKKRKPEQRSEEVEVGAVEVDVRPMGRKRSKRAADGNEGIAAELKELIAAMASRHKNEEEEERLATLKSKFVGDRELIMLDNSRISCPHRLAYIVRQQERALSRLNSSYYSEITSDDEVEN